MKLLKEAKAKSFETVYTVKLFDEENGEFCVYANNNHFNWGGCTMHETKKEAEKYFSDILKLYDFYKWEVKNNEYE